MSRHGRRVIMPQMCRYPGHEYTWIKAKIKVIFLYIFHQEKGLSHMVHHCALYSVKADIQHIMVTVKLLCFVFVVNRISVLLFCPRKTIFYKFFKPILDNILNTKVFTCYNYLHASGEFCRLPIAFCKQFEPRRRPTERLS